MADDGRKKYELDLPRFASGMAVGIAIGTGVGVALDSFTMGIAIGTPIGVSLGIAFSEQAARENKDDASGE